MESVTLDVDIINIFNFAGPSGKVDRADGARHGFLKRSVSERLFQFYDRLRI